MRWQRLFAELEYELAQGADDEAQELAREESRLRESRWDLRARVIGFGTTRGVVAVETVLGVRTIAVDTVGADWFAGRQAHGAYTVLRLDEVVAFVRPEPLADLRAGNEGVQESRAVPFTIVMRDLVRRRVPLLVEARTWSAYGTLSGAWADHCELAVHPRGHSCRRENVREWRIAPLGTIVAVSPEERVG